MPTLSTWLLVFKYAGLVVASGSTIWGLTHEVSTKDAQNRRRLTPAGRYSIALAVLGLFISLNTAAIESINKQRADEQAASEKRRDEERAAEKEERDRQQRTLERLEDLQRQESEKREQREREEEERRREEAWQQEQRDSAEEARYQREREVAEQQRRAIEILTQVSRSVERIETIELHAWVEVPVGHPALRKFKRRLDAALDGNLRNASLPPGNRIRVLALTSSPELTQFEPGEELAHHLILTSGHVELALYKEPIDPEEFGLAGSAPNATFEGYRRPDLEFGISEPERSARLDAFYEFRDVSMFDLPPVESVIRAPRRLVVHPSGFKPDPSHLKGTGRIRGVPDLLGAQLFLYVSGYGLEDEEISRTAEEIRRHARVVNLVLKINDREFWIRGKRMRHFPSKGPDLAAYSVFSFPATEEGLRLLEPPNAGR